MEEEEKDIDEEGFKVGGDDELDLPPEGLGGDFEIDDPEDRYH